MVTWGQCVLQENGWFKLECVLPNCTSLCKSLDNSSILCLAGEWFRCEVIEVRTSRILVNFFDYGNEAALDLSDLRPLPRDLCERYPLCTFRCSIHGEWRKDLCDCCPVSNQRCVILIAFAPSGAPFMRSDLKTCVIVVLSVTKDLWDHYFLCIFRCSFLSE